MNPGLYLLHRAGWVHRDPSPGNIIVVRENANTSDRKIAKISDLEFAKRRVAAELEKLTKPKGASSIGARDIRTVGLFLARFYELKRSSPGDSGFRSHRG